MLKGAFARFFFMELGASCNILREKSWVISLRFARGRFQKLITAGVLFINIKHFCHLLLVLSAAHRLNDFRNS